MSLAKLYPKDFSLILARFRPRFKVSQLETHNTEIIKSQSDRISDSSVSLYNIMSLAFPDRLDYKFSYHDHQNVRFQIFLNR